MQISKNPIVRLALSVMLPTIILLSFYTQFHGEVSPGGGFQAGAIMASALSVVVMLYGDTMKLSKLIKFCRVGASVGVAIYALTGVLPLFLHAQFLEHAAIGKNFFGKDFLGNEIGIFSVELGVGLAVFSVFSMIITIFIAEVEDYDIN